MKLGLVGNGTVGHATARAFVEWCEIRVYDVRAERRTHSLAEVLACDLVMVSLPTPQSANGLACDLTAVEEFCADVGFRGARAAPLVLRSTVPVGTTRRLRDRYGLVNLVHSPEFLTARCAVVDAQTPSRNIIGGPAECPTVERLSHLYFRRFPGVPIFHMDSDESELVKLALNGFFTTKVVYFCFLRRLADKLGLDWDRVMGGVMSDGRVAHAHTRVPGNGGKWGAGGHCLPKDFANLIDCFGQAGLDPGFLRVLLDDNAAMLRS